MSQKTKATILIVIILLVTAGFGVYIFKKNRSVSMSENSSQSTQRTVLNANEKSTQNELQSIQVEGKVRSINEKQTYIELSDGSGSAINIQPSVPVRTEGKDEIGNLSFLKEGSSVSVKVNENNDALEILIKK